MTKKTKFLQATVLDQGVVTATWLLDKVPNGATDTSTHSLHQIQECVEIAAMAFPEMLDDALKDNSDWQRVDAYHVPNMRGVIVRAANALNNDFKGYDLHKAFVSHNDTDGLLRGWRERCSFFNDRHVFIGRLLTQLSAFHSERANYNHDKMSSALREIEALTKLLTKPTVSEI